jgi:hypothetical protein
LNTAPTKNRSIIGFRVRFQTEEITEKGDGRGNAKESFTKMYKHIKMKNPIWGKMIQGYIKEAKEMVKKGRSWKAQTSTNRGHKKNNLTRVERRNPMLFRRSPLGKTLILDQALIR